MTQTCRHCTKPIKLLRHGMAEQWTHSDRTGRYCCTKVAEPLPEPGPDASPETMKSLLKTIFPVAWKADRGRQDPELMAAYVSTQRILGLTKEEIEEMS